MTMAEMQRKIESLEKRVRELESRPQEVHYHYQVSPIEYPSRPQYPNEPQYTTCLGVR